MTRNPAISWGTILPAIRAWISDGSGFDLDDPGFPSCSTKVRLADGGTGRPPAPHIEFEVTETRQLSHDWQRVEANPLVFAAKAVTIVDSTTNELAIVGHGLLIGDGPVQVVSGGTPPGGLAVDTDYWVVKVDDDHIKLSPTFLESMGDPSTVVVDITSGGSGALHVAATDASERVGEEIKRTATGIRLVRIMITCFGKEGTGFSPMQVLTDVMSYLQFHVYDLNEAGFSVSELGASFAQGSVQSIPGQRGGIREPRARIEVMGYVGSSVERFENYIATIESTVNVQSVDGHALASVPLSVTIADQGDA